VATPSTQLAARHAVLEPGYEQPSGLLPSQAPVHAEPSPSQAGRLPCGAPPIGVQVPALSGASQAWHCPRQRSLQHTPSTQKPEAQAAALAHAWPSARLAVQMPASQTEPDAQSSSSAQSPKQLSAAQTNGAQARWLSAGQKPLPSQYAASVATPALQLPARHRVVASG
jgi:hypothetical protein